MKIKQHGSPNPQLVDWNDRMYLKHPTPCSGITGVIGRSRLRTILNFAQIKSDDAVLEIGCESGNLLVKVPNARRIVGADISEIALENAVRLFENRGRFAEFLQLDAEQPLPFSRGEFDVIICSETLEHVQNPRAVLENIHRISTADTRIVISIPIEAPKVFIKKLLSTTGLLKVLFGSIEAGQSEWHLHVFSKKKLHDMTFGLFEVKRHKTLWPAHYVAGLLRK